MAMRNENMDKRQNYVTWVEIALQFTKNFAKQTLQKMLKQDLTLQIMNQKDCYLGERPEINSYLINYNNENKKETGSKRYMKKKKNSKNAQRKYYIFVILHN